DHGLENSVERFSERSVPGDPAVRGPQPIALPGRQHACFEAPIDEIASRAEPIADDVIEIFSSPGARPGRSAAHGIYEYEVQLSCVPPESRFGQRISLGRSSH